MRQYRKSRPRHCNGVPYAQESVWVRLRQMVDIIVLGKTSITGISQRPGAKVSRGKPHMHEAMDEFREEERRTTTCSNNYSKK